MKLDIIIYGRGQTREDGYQTFTAPRYWSEQMLLAMNSFNELWTSGDRSDEFPEAFENDPNPWGKTYMLTFAQPPYCCAFLRVTRVEGEEPGTWLKEARNYDIWSLEGFCCQFEQRDRFFAMVPSMIAWFEKDNTSLYGRFKKNEIGASVEVPEVYNPYSESPLPDEIDELFASVNAKDEYMQLCNSIHYSASVFQLIYGPLAEFFYESVGRHYGINEVISTLKYEDKKSEINDPLKKMQLIQKRTKEVKQTVYKLRLKVVNDRHEGAGWRWGIYDIKDPHEDKLKSSERYIGEKETIYATDLLSEASAILEFARNMNWKVEEFSTGSDMFTFRKEE